MYLLFICFFYLLKEVRHGKMLIEKRRRDSERFGNLCLRPFYLSGLIQRLTTMQTERLFTQFQVSVFSKWCRGRLVSVPRNCSNNSCNIPNDKRVCRELKKFENNCFNVWFIHVSKAIILMSAEKYALYSQRKKLLVAFR